MINDTHGAFIDSADAVSIGRVDTLVDTLTAKDGEYIKIHNGDAFQGSYISGMTYGLPLIEAFNAIEFDCFVLGNHEFDWGIDKIAAYADGDTSNGEANFPFLGANIYKSGTTERPDWIDAYTIVNYGQIQVGIIGVMGPTQESSILTRYVEDYNFVDPIDIIKKYSKELRTEKGCEVVVVATHEYDSSLNNRIASLKDDSKIDSIFCAHTHQRINETVNRYDGKKIPVVQNSHKNNSATAVTINLDNQYEMTSSSVKQYFPSSYAISSEIQVLINKYQDYIDDSNEVLGTTSQYISKSQLGKYAADAMIDYIYNESLFDGKIDMAMMNTGGIRATIDSGEITKADIFEVFPFNNIVILVNIDGASLKSIYNSNKSYLYVDFADSISSINNVKDNEIYQLAVIDYVFESTYSSYDPFDRLNPSQYIETDIGLQEGFRMSDGSYVDVYNNGSSIARGVCRLVYTSSYADGGKITDINERHVFYTYNHYNDFQEYLNYYGGWSNRFGNESSGNPYCGSTKQYNSLSNPNKPTSYIESIYVDKNTLKYKLAKIREILGYDITTNENRMNIMLAMKIRKLRT